MQEDVKSIEDVIVTALGLERNYVDLTYAADKIKGSQLTAVKSPNLILSLAGKSAGHARSVKPLRGRERPPR